MIEPPFSGSESMALSTTEIELLRNMISRLDTFVSASFSFAHSGNFVHSGTSRSVSAFMSHSALS